MSKPNCIIAFRLKTLSRDILALGDFPSSTNLSGREEQKNKEAYPDTMAQSVKEDVQQSVPQSAEPVAANSGKQEEDSYAADMAAERKAKPKDPREVNEENVQRALRKVRSNPTSPTQEQRTGEGEKGKGKGAPQEPTEKGQQPNIPITMAPRKGQNSDMESDFSRKAAVEKPIPPSVPSTPERTNEFLAGSVAAAARSLESRVHGQGTEAEGTAQREQAEKAPSASDITVSRWKKVDGDEGQLQILVEQLSRMEARLASMQQALDRKDEMIQNLVMKISAREAQAAGVQLS